MDSYIVLMVGLAAIWLSAPLIVIALVVLWAKSRSPWLLLALVGECVSYGFRVGLSIAPSALGDLSMAELVLPIAAWMLAIGLLGYAISAKKHAKAVGCII